MESVGTTSKNPYGVTSHQGNNSSATPIPNNFAVDKTEMRNTINGTMATAEEKKEELL